jgi:thiol:disulfide interchange protein
MRFQPPLDQPECQESKAPSRRGARFGPIGIVLPVVIAALAWFMYRPSPQIMLAAENAPWAQEWNDAVRRSQATRKPALVLYTADWCPGCRWFEGNTLVRADVRGVMESRYTPIKVDLTSRESPNQALARQYQIAAIPTLILYDVDGRELARTHALGPDELLAWLRSDGRKTR